LGAARVCPGFYVVAVCMGSFTQRARAGSWGVRNIDSRRTLWLKGLEAPGLGTHFGVVNTVWKFGLTCVVNGEGWHSVQGAHPHTGCGGRPRGGTGGGGGSAGRGVPVGGGGMGGGGAGGGGQPGIKTHPCTDDAEGLESCIGRWGSTQNPTHSDHTKEGHRDREGGSGADGKVNSTGGGGGDRPTGGGPNLTLTPKLPLWGRAAPNPFCRL